MMRESFLSLADKVIECRQSQNMFVTEGRLDVPSRYRDV
jgi:hypothetical protein